MLRSAWCRSLTGEVLLLGRSAYPFVAVDRDEPGALADLLAGAQGELAAVPEPRLRRVLRDLRPPLPRSPDPAGDDRAPVNLLGMLRGTAVGRSATFLVFRDPPKPDWLAAAAARDGAGHLLREIRPMAADRARLAPMEPPDWVLDVMIGLAAGSGTSPTTRWSGSPGPPSGPTSRCSTCSCRRRRRCRTRPSGSWLRLRVGAPYRRGDSLRKLVRFLAALDGLRVGRAARAPAGGTADGVAGRDPDRAGGLLRRAARGAGADHRQDQSPAGSSPTSTSGCRPGRRTPGGWSRSARSRASGLLAEVLSALHEHAGARALAGAISGVFDGTMVVFLLCRPAAGRLDPDAVAAVEEATRPYRTVVRLLDGVPARAGRRGDPRPLLRVQVRTPDRPGVMQDLLRELAARLSSGGRPGRRALRADPGRRRPGAVRPAAAAAAAPGRRRGGPAVDWQDMGRLVAQAVARTSGGAARPTPSAPPGSPTTPWSRWTSSAARPRLRNLYRPLDTRLGRLSACVMTAVQTRPGWVLLARWLGLSAALGALSRIMLWDDLGIAFSLTAPLLGIGLIVGVYAGGLVGTGRQLGPSRRALLETRRLTDYLPHTLRWVAWLLAAYGVAALLSTFPVGVVVVTACRSNTDLWVPQRYTSISSAGVAAGLALAAVVLRRLVSRPRPDERDVAEDDRHRREATASVIAACGVLVAGALAWSLGLLGAVVHEDCAAGLGGVDILLAAAALAAGAVAVTALWAVLVPPRPARRPVSR